MGGRPGDGDEIEAVLRRFFGNDPGPLAGLVAGPLRKAIAAGDAAREADPLASAHGRFHVSRVGRAEIEGDVARADFSAVYREPGDDEGAFSVQYTAPMTLRRDEEGWKLVDYLIDGSSATSGILDVDARAAARGVQFLTDVLIRRPRGSYVVAELVNERSSSVWIGDALAYGAPVRFRPGGSYPPVTVASGASASLLLTFPSDPFRERFWMYVPVFDLSKRRWTRLRVRGRVAGIAR